MSEISAAQKEQNWVDRYTNGIKKGIWTFADVGARDWKEEIKNRLMKEIEDGSANDTTINAVADYFADQIKRNRITINDIPDIMKSKVEGKI